MIDPSSNETFAKPSPLMIQGGIEGGLVDAFRFGGAHLAPLVSHLRENDGSLAKVSLELWFHTVSGSKSIPGVCCRSCEATRDDVPVTTHAERSVIIQSGELPTAARAGRPIDRARALHPVCIQRR